MSYVYVAAQEWPYELYNSLFFKLDKKAKSRVSEYINIIKKYHPDYDKNQIKQLLFELKKSGCAYSVVANSIAEQLYEDDDSFTEMFSFPLTIKNTDVLDYNRIMIDLFSMLHNTIKITIVKYDKYLFSSAKEAVKELLNKEVEEEKAHNELYEAGYYPDGIVNGKLRFKYKEPRVKTLYGTYSEIFYQFYGIYNNNITKEELISKLKQDGYEFGIEYDNPASKVSGLTCNSLNFWINYYLKKHDIDYEFKGEDLNMESYDNYDDFINELINLNKNGTTIEVSAHKGKMVKINYIGTKDWIEPYNDMAGHAMTFKYLTENGDIVVTSSAGIETLIPKEYIPNLSFRTFKILSKEYEIESNRNVK